MRDSNLASDRKDVLALHDLFPSLEVLDRQRVTHPADVHDPVQYWIAAPRPWSNG
ncbi:hypothetical protein [Mycobacteroides abscessus]|uniref:hypothetical protein n=1 Tax=Mycobacteroides abscessus TaxID=36809 RepID=UPI0013F5EA00|nr:hypothetical protein [Mycobacteroides abscessus]